MLLLSWISPVRESVVSPSLGNAQMLSQDEKRKTGHIPGHFVSVRDGAAVKILSGNLE